MTAKRVMHIVEASFAGVGRHVLDLAIEQSLRGHDVHILYSPVRESESFAARRGEAGTVSFRAASMTRSVGLTDVNTIVRASRIVSRLRPDVIHGHSTKGGIIARSVRRGTAKVLYTPHAVYSMNPDLGVKARCVVGNIERLLSLRTDSIIAVSPEEAEHLRSLGVDDRRIAVIPNGITFEPPTNPADVRTALGLPVEGFVFGFVGRLDDQKAPDDLVHAFNRIASATDADLHLAIVGDGPHSERLETSRGQSPHAGNIHLLGERPGRWAMNAFDAFVLPSRYEGFPYVLLEAAQAGLPIITTDRACASQLVGGSDDGWVVPAGDVEALATAMAASLDPVARGSAAKASQRRGASFTLGSMVDAVEQLIV